MITIFGDDSDFWHQLHNNSLGLFRSFRNLRPHQQKKLHRSARMSRQLEAEFESPRSHEVLATRQDSCTAPLKQRRNAKPVQRRNRTYARRKVEIHKLKDEVKILEKQRQFLASQEYLRHRRVQKQYELENKAMRDAVQAQHLLFAASMSFLSQTMREMGVSPFSVPLKLDKDPRGRQTALLRTRHEKLQLAHQFMLQRLKFLEMAGFCDRKKFEASNGDLLSLHFETTPIPEARNVKAIVDALQSFVYSIDGSLSDAVGAFTAQENSKGKRESPVTHHRLVTTTEDLTQIESNTVAFTEYWPATLRDNAYGLLVCDTVDEDELFPYRPLNRVRHDLNMIAMVSWRKGNDGKPVALLSRWWRQRIRKSRAQFPPSVEHFRRNVDKLDAAMLSIARNAAQNT